MSRKVHSSGKPFKCPVQMLQICILNSQKRFIESSKTLFIRRKHELISIFSKFLLNNPEKKHRQALFTEN